MIRHVRGDAAAAPRRDRDPGQRQRAPPRKIQSIQRAARGRQDWYGVEILETLFQLRGRIRKRELESSRNLPQFRVVVVCAELFEDYREDVRSKLLQAGCSKVRPAAGAAVRLGLTDGLCLEAARSGSRSES
jgi:hypothetical protein